MAEAPLRKILVVEDEMIISMNLCDTLESLGYHVSGTCVSFDEAILALETEKPDVALVDIKINGSKTGIDLGHVINDRFKIPFIYLTSNSDKSTINQAKTSLPASYLLKPFEADELYAAIEVAAEQQLQASNSVESLSNSIFIKKNQLLHKVYYKDIVYIKSDHVYLELYTSDGEKHLMRGSMSQFLTTLPNNFFRTHRSYAVNLDFLSAINSLYVIVSDFQVPIGKTYRGVLLERVRIA